MAEKDIATQTTTSGSYVIVRQFVSSEALASQTISGTIKGQVRAYETHSGANCDLAVRVALCASDGTNVRELLAIKSEGNAAGNPVGGAPEFVVTPTTPTNRKFEEGAADYALDLTSTAADANDRLIVEVGYGMQTTSSTRRGILVFGDDSGTDLAEDETTTTANNPWVEFSMDITFAGGGPPATPAFRLSLLRAGR